MALTNDAENARFNAFMAATEAAERDWIAFLEFERAIDEVLHAAALVNCYDEGEAWSREQAAMRPAIAQMLYRVLPRVGFGTILADACGIGYAIRFGVIHPTPNGLDHVGDDETFAGVAQQGYDAEDADTRMRLDAIKDERKKQQRRATRGNKVPTQK